MTLRLTGEGHQAAHRLAVHVRGESPFMSRRSCQRESDGSNPKPSVAPADGDGRLPGACARYTTAPASGTTPAATSAPPKPHEAEPPRTEKLREIGAEPHRVESGATPRGRHRLAGEGREEHEGHPVEGAVADRKGEEEWQTRGAAHTGEHGRHADENRDEHRAPAITISHAPPCRRARSSIDLGVPRFGGGRPRSPPRRRPTHASVTRAFTASTSSGVTVSP